MPRRGSARDTQPATGDLAVVEHRFDNGLELLVVPRGDAPIVVSDFHVRAGSVDDPRGSSGMAHLVEHLMFQGTARFPKGQIDLLTFLAGGSTNAETGEDYTHYWFALPADALELALTLEADRLQHTRFDALEFERERRVILEERARELDSAAGRLEELHIAFSYLNHPYRNPIFGWIDELRDLRLQDAQTWLAAHYRPCAALLVVVGRVDPATVIDQVGRTLGALPGGPPAATRAVAPEQPQVGRREFVVEDGEGLPRALLGWHSVPRAHADSPALDVLADLLAGGTSARLKLRLVDRGRLATWVQASQEGGRLSGQFLIRLEATPGADPARVEAEVLAELAQLATHGPTKDELARARQRLQAAWRWEQQDAAGLAAGLGGVALWQGWRAWPAEHRAALAVESDDIRRVARTFFPRTGLTVGWTRPTTRPSAHVAETLSALDVLVQAPCPPRAGCAVELGDAAERLALGSTGPPLAVNPQRRVLSNGLRLITEPARGTQVVAIELYCDAGMVREAKPGLACLTSRLREELRHPATRRKLVEPLEDAGGHVEFVPTGLSIRAASEQLEACVELISHAMIAPRFERGRFLQMRDRTDDELRGELHDGLYHAGRQFLKRIYGRHPLGRDPRGTRAQLAALELDDVRAHQARWFVPDHAFLVATGDFDPQTLDELLERRLHHWLPSGAAAPPLPRVTKAPAPCRLRLRRPGEQVHILLGHLGVTQRDPDLAALTILDHILGSGPGFVDRLSRVLRDELGLAYAVGGGMTDSADLLPGVLRIYVGTNNQAAHQACAAVRHLLVELHAGRFGDDEVRAAQQYLARSYIFDYQNISSRAERLLEMERWGQSPAHLVSWPERVAQVEPAAVRAAARRHLHPERLVEVVSGPLEAVRVD